MEQDCLLRFLRLGVAKVTVPTPKKIVVISGLTASGKTALSVQLAQRFNGEIVSADSRQVYRFLDIGTAKITTAEQQGVPHHLLDVVDPRTNTRYSVGDYVRDATVAIDQILARGKIPFVVGGTGLYSRAVINGYNFGNQPNTPRYTVLQICLTPPKALLAPQVRARNTARIQNGMFAETENLLKMGVARSFLYDLGLEYRLNIRYMAGEIDLPTYERELFYQTMQFIKRQRTWYRKENPDVTHYLTDPTTYLTTATQLIADFLDTPPGS